MVQRERSEQEIGRGAGKAANKLQLREDTHLLRKLFSLSLSLRISEHVFKTSEKPGGYDDERFIHKLFLDKCIATFVD